MAMAKVSSDNSIAAMNGLRRFGRSRENELEDIEDRLLSPCDVMPLSCANNSTEKPWRLDVMLNVLNANSRTVSAVNRHSTVVTEFVSGFIATHTSLLCDNSSPLIESDRYFIALMAAEVHRCHSLVCIYANEFLLHGGDVKWLKGLRGTSTHAQTHLPHKFRHLSEINDLLAHTPWMITKGHIAKLASNSGERWSMSQLIQAVIILAHVHSLASLVAGFRLIPGQTTNVSSRVHEELTPQQNAKLSIGSKCGSTLYRHLSNKSGVELVENFINDPSMSCVELCQKRHEQVDVSTSLNPHYFSWEVQGYSLANVTNIQFGDLIDEELASVKKLFHSHVTDHSDVLPPSHRVGNHNLMENVSSAVSDSQRYYAVWQYVHCLLGICYEDYKYSQLEALLSSDLRSYIKLATYHPERLYEDRFKHIVQSIGDVEMMNVNSIVAEARLQVELMFCFNAVLVYQTESSVVR